VTRSRLPDVETLACAVAGEYAARWARSVARMQARGDAADAGAWLVDGFAGADLQRAALRGTPVQPSAAAFARAAREAFGDGARVVLVEEDPGLLARLESELAAAGADPRRASHPADAAPGEVVLVEAPFASVASRLAGEVADAPALVRLAPLSARVLPWGTLELLADLSGADLLIRIPQEDFARAGKFGGPLADFPPHLRRVVEGISSFFADERHGWLLAWREAARAGGDEAALASAVERLRGMLGNGGGERTARAARLEGAGGAAVHVVLSSPHPEHALELNGAVTDAGAPPPAPAKSARSAAGRKSAAAAKAAATEPAPAAAAPPPEAAAPTDSAASPPESASAAPAAQPDPTPTADAAPPTSDAAVEPTAPDTGVEPVTPAEPTAPVEPERAEPAASAEPKQAEPEPRTEPDLLFKPTASAEPDVQLEPTAPAELDLQSEPRAPAEPQQAELSAPVRPDGPAESAPIRPRAEPSASAKPEPRAEPQPSEEPPALLDLFALEPTPFEPELPRGPDLREVADDLHARHEGRRVPFRELLGDLADAGLAPEQVRTVLGLLKRDRRAAYRSLDADGAEVEFLAAPAAPPPPPAPKPRKARKPVPGMLGLFDEPEPEDEPPPMPLADALEPDDELPMTLADAIGALEGDAADAQEAPVAEPAKKPRRRKAE
jgi:hypothetical protein